MFEGKRVVGVTIQGTHGGCRELNTVRGWESGTWAGHLGSSPTSSRPWTPISVSSQGDARE